MTLVSQQKAFVVTTAEEERLTMEQGHELFHSLTWKEHVIPLDGSSSFHLSGKGLGKCTFLCAQEEKSQVGFGDHVTSSLPQ